MNNVPQKAVLAFGLVMVTLFLFCGIVFLLSDFLLVEVPRPNRTYLAWVFFIYVGLRSIRLYQQYTKLKRDEREE